MVLLEINVIIALHLGLTLQMRNCLFNCSSNIRWVRMNPFISYLIIGCVFQQTVRHLFINYLNIFVFLLILLFWQKGDTAVNGEDKLADYSGASRSSKEVIFDETLDELSYNWLSVRDLLWKTWRSRRRKIKTKRRRRKAFEPLLSWGKRNTKKIRKGVIGKQKSLRHNTNYNFIWIHLNKWHLLFAHLRHKDCHSFWTQLCLVFDENILQTFET